VTHWNADTQYTAEELIEETAWWLIEDKGWVPTPLLLMWLERFIDETIDAKKLVEITD
jgi:ribosomal protein S12 methylthiotransferase accessory factor YcaO